MNQKFSGYALLAGIATLLALIVVMLGAYTRLADAGLGCPDWPGCYGHLTVPKSTTAIAQAQQTYQQIVEPAKAWKEMIHRYFAGTLGILIVILTFWGLMRKRKHPEQPIAIPIILLLLVIFQAVLGMWTVTWLVQPLVVSSHLLGGLAITALLWSLTLATKTQQSEAKPASGYKFWAVLGLLILIGQLFLGAWTSTNYAALACLNFPFCHGNLFPPMNFHEAFSLFHPIGINYEGGVLDSTARVTIQMMHRYGAFVTAVYLGILALCLIFSKAEKKLRGLGWVLLGVLALQFALGVANVELLLPIQIAVAHNGVACLLLLTMVTLIYRLFCRAKS
ncbi:MAG TPA: COX15/CtaA family protein [Gammaproteobacteria bacterium]|nr:COX15/CtaA family protein [Gammaproteobacteria bacterium]